MAFEAKFSTTPDVYAAHGYDAVMMIALAIGQAGLDPQELRFYLNSMNPYDGVTGTTDFDEAGDVQKYHHDVRYSRRSCGPSRELIVTVFRQRSATFSQGAEVFCTAF